MSKHNIAILWMCLCLSPSLATAENPQVSSLNEAGQNLAISGTMSSDDELVQMVGHGLQTPLPKGAVIYGGTGILVPARIKLWDEADKAPVNTIYSQSVLFMYSKNNH